MINDGNAAKPCGHRSSRSSRRKQRRNKARAMAEEGIARNDFAQKKTEETVIESVQITEIFETSDSDTAANENQGIICEAETDTESQTKDEDRDYDSSTETTQVKEEEPTTSYRVADAEEDTRSRLEPTASKPPINDSLHQKKAKKKEALMQYFLPVYHNPRFLEVINEESSDASDKEFNGDKRTAEILPANITEIPLHTQELTPGSETSVEVVFLPDGSSSQASTETDASTDEESTSKTIEDNTAPVSLSPMTPPPSPNVEFNTFNFSPDLLQYTESVLHCTLSNDSREAEILLDDSRSAKLPEELKRKLLQLCGHKEDDAKIAAAENVVAVTTSSVSPSFDSRASSVSSTGSSSRATSLCTARYNPSKDSLVDIASLVERHQPLTLRELCINFLLSLPFGPDMLRELANVSKVINEVTSSLPSRVISSLLRDNMKQQLTYPPFLARLSEGRNKTCFKIPEKRKTSAEMQDLDDGKQNRTEEAHTNPLGKEEDVGSSKNQESAANRSEDRKVKPSPEKQDLYLYYEENSSVETLSVPAAEKTSSLNRDKSRLQARELSEWLELARGKSISDSNLNTCGRTLSACSTEPAANKFLDHKQRRAPVDNRRTDHSRRASLPNAFYQQQLLMIQEKEREIQRQLEQLEEEKRKITAEMNDLQVREFAPEEYTISPKGDIAIYNERRKETNPACTPTEGEVFRQQMYDEYMEQIAAREDRKVNKVIKLSAPPQQNENSPMFEAVHLPDIEDEFMEQVKRRRLGGGNRDDSDEVASSIFDKSDQETDSEPVLVLEGSSVARASGLPRHIQEFADMTAKAAAEKTREQDEEGECDGMRVFFGNTFL